MEVDYGTDQLSGDFHNIAVAGGSDVDFTSQIQLQEAIRASSKLASSSSNADVFCVYFKGLVSQESVLNIKMSLAGIGAAIYDATGVCVFKSQKTFFIDADVRGSEGDLVELEALIEALNVAVNHELKRIHIFYDNSSVYQYLTGKTQPTNNKIGKLVDRLHLLQNKFIHQASFHVKQNDVKNVYKLAKEAIASEITKWAKSNSDVAILHQCTICFDYLKHDKMFSINICLHKYCYSCIKRHVEAKLLQGQMPKCPHENCESTIGFESCRKFLKPELYKIMRSRVKEASIPVNNRVYCPFSKCSALMSKTEAEQHIMTKSIGKRKCVECNKFFCINCEVPWHKNITCSDYMESSKFKSSNDAKLKSLATEKLWQECGNCKNLIELESGCTHMRCRCGYEFCYRCGAKSYYHGCLCKHLFRDERRDEPSDERRDDPSDDRRDDPRDERHLTFFRRLRNRFFC